MVSPCSDFSLARCVELGIKSCYKCDHWREAIVLDYHRFVVQGKPRPQKFKCVRIKAPRRPAVVTPKTVLDAASVAADPSREIDPSVASDHLRRVSIRRAQVIEDTLELRPRKRPKKKGTEFLWTEESFNEAMIDDNAPLSPLANPMIMQNTSRHGNDRGVNAIVVLGNSLTLPPPPPPPPIIRQQPSPHSSSTTTG